MFWRIFEPNLALRRLGQSVRFHKRLSSYISLPFFGKRHLHMFTVEESWFAIGELARLMHNHVLSSSDSSSEAIGTCQYPSSDSWRHKGTELHLKVLLNDNTCTTFLICAQSRVHILYLKIDKKGWTIFVFWFHEHIICYIAEHID